MTYLELDQKLQGRCKHRRKLSRNTTAHRDYSGLTRAIFIQYHNTDILSFYPNGDIRMHIGGWFTVTTKQRLNQYLPNGFGVYSYKGTWMVWKWGGHFPGPQAIFENGMTLHLDGSISGAQSFADWEADRLEGIRQSRSRGAKKAAATRVFARESIRQLGGEAYFA